MMAKTRKRKKTGRYQRWKNSRESDRLSARDASFSKWFNKMTPAQQRAYAKKHEVTR